MSVVIDEMISEVEASPPARAASADVAAPASQPEDLDRIAFQMGRRHQRAERLWAD